MPSSRVSVLLRIPPELHAALTEEAKEQKRSLNNLIEVMLDRALELDPLMDGIANDR